MSDLIGKVLGNYQIQREIGQGTYGTVYLGEHIHLRTLAAIKVLSTFLPEGVVGRFREQARMIAQLNHTHIVRVLDFGIMEGSPPYSIPFYVMEYIANGTLAQRLPPKMPLPLRDTIDLMLQACQALDYAHQQSILHGDVKPNNMLLRSDKFLLLSDFSPWEFTSALDKQFISFVAPEWLQGRCDERSDLYSIGSVLYCAVTGHMPFEGNTSLGTSLIETIKNFPTALLPLPSQFVPDLPPMVEQVIIKALEKDPDRRYQSATEMIVALESIAIALGASAPPKTPDKQAAIPAKAPAPTPQNPKPRVLVSHSHQNDEFTARFVADLRAAGVEVWVDMTNIQHGDFMTRINEALNTYEWLVLVLTPDALASPAVQNEVNAAINRVWHKRMKGFIPFMALSCDPEAIPAMWDTFHRYDATSDYKRALAGLLRALGIE